MKTAICPTCGCSLVRLGITPEKAATRKYQKEEYAFCCEGCAVLFDENSETLLKETGDIVVCPSCLAEKPIRQTVTLDHKGETFHFCRCPHCVTVFQKNPEYYTKRLSGEIDFLGIFSEGEGCCN